MMGLHLLVGTAALLSAVGESMAATSLTLLDCGGIKFKHELYTQSELPVPIEDTDLTFLVPWLDAGQVRKLGLNDYGNGAYVRKSYNSMDEADVILGWVLSQGNSQIYLPGEEEKSGGFSRLFFENYLLNTARRHRLVILSLPEDANMSMSNDSLNSLTRLMSIPKEPFEINLVAVAEETESTRMYYDTDHHNSYIRSVIRSCRECSLISVRRWVVTQEEASKNFPSIPYVTSEIWNFFQVFQQGQEEKVQNLRTLTCMQSSQAGASVISPLRSKNRINSHLRSPTQAIGRVYPYEPPVPEWDTFRQARINDDFRSSMYDSGASDIHADLLVDHFLLRNRKDDSSLLRVIDRLAPLDKTRNSKVRKSGEEPSLFLPVEKCLWKILTITGEYFPLEIHGKGCDFSTVVVRASKALQITNNIVLPGKNLIIHSPELISYDNYSIDLSAKDCNDHYGGNFNIFVTTYHGPPLHVITNGGKVCDVGHTKRDYNTMWNLGHSIDAPFGEILENPARHSGSNAPGRRGFRNGGASARKGSVRKMSRNAGKLKNIELEKGFASSLARRDVIQIFAGHVINDFSMDGEKLIRQARVLGNLGWRKGSGASRRMHDSFNPPPFIDPIEIGDVGIKTYRGGDASNDWCFNVQIDNYEIECAIDFMNTLTNEASLELGKRLREHSVATESCHQIIIPYVTEYDLFLCNLTVLDLTLERNLIQMDDGLTCYYDTIFKRKVLSCRLPKNVTNSDEMTAHVVDIAWAVLTMRHMFLNPLDMTRISIKNFGHSTNNELFSKMLILFNETHKLLVKDLDNFYEEVLVMKSISLFDKFKYVLGGDKPLPKDTEIGEIICWAGFIRSKVLGPAPMSNIYPMLFEELMHDTTDTIYFDFLRKQLINEALYNFEAFVGYLKYFKNKIIYYPEDVRENLLEIIERYEDKAQNQTGTEIQRRVNVNNVLVRADDEDDIKVSEELRQMMRDFQSEIIAFEESLTGPILVLFHRTIGKLVRQQGDMLNVFRATSSIVVNRTEWEFLSDYPLEFLIKIGSECKSFNLDLQLKKSFVEAKSNPELYLNELYMTVMQNLDEQRKALEELAPLEVLMGEMKAHMEAVLYLEREVYKSLQSMARSNDVKQALEKVKSFSGDNESVKVELAGMYDSMNWSLAYLIFSSALIDFQQRIFPYWDDLSSLFHPNNISYSLRELEKTEQDYLANFKEVGFDPQNESIPVEPYFTWNAEDIGYKNLKNFFRGYPLFLLAKAEGQFPYPLKGIKFAVRFIPKSNYHGEWTNQLRRTEIHIRPGSYAFNYCAGKTYFSAAKSTRFIQTIGIENRGEEDIPVSPYTLWRLRISRIRVDFPENMIDKIQLIGHGLVLDSPPPPPDYSTSWEPSDTSKDIYFTLPRQELKN